ncbi:MAG: hypothetical protein JW904_00350 [Spirochaetales bacterium]|nr:hypothetical protein [Spirochaetales bacterium]
MALQDLYQFLAKEKEKLFKAKDYISSYYYQIISSLEGLRDHLFPYAFSDEKLWKDSVNHKATRLTIPDLVPKNIHTDTMFNSNTLIAVINNIYAIQNSYLFNPLVIEIIDIKLIRKAHTFLLAFLTEQFANPNINLLQKHQRDLAFTLKKNIEDRIETNITPFFDRLEMILGDIYFINLFDHAKIIIGSYTTYREEMSMYDELLRKKSNELGVKNNPELNLIIIADLEKSESQIATEISSKYELADKKKAVSKAYRLREIAARYCTQHENLQILGEFLRESLDLLRQRSLFKRILNFFRIIFTGRGDALSGGDVHFSFLTLKGKIERNKVSLKELITTISLYDDHLQKFKGVIESNSYSKTVNPQLYSDIEKFVNTSYSELNEIFEKSNGFREWLGRENNSPLLRRISDRRQTDFSNTLLLLNRIIIVNRYSLQEFEKYQEKI